jgi:hypothetical protein
MNSEFQLLLLLLGHFEKTAHNGTFANRLEIEDKIFGLYKELLNNPFSPDNTAKKWTLQMVMMDLGMWNTEAYYGDRNAMNDCEELKAEEAEEVAEIWEDRLPVPVYGLRAESARIFHRSDRKAHHRGHRCGRK